MARSRLSISSCALRKISASESRMVAIAGVDVEESIGWHGADSDEDNIGAEREDENETGSHGTLNP